MKIDDKNILDPEVRQYELSFRAPRQVEFKSEKDSDGHDTTFPVCPRCHLPLRRINQEFCAECGQKLHWGVGNNSLN